MMSPGDVAAVVRSVAIDGRAQVDFIGATIQVSAKVDARTSRATAVAIVRKAKAVVRAALLAADTGRKFKHARRGGHRVWHMTSGAGLSYGVDGMATGIELVLTAEEKEARLLGCGLGW